MSARWFVVMLPGEDPQASEAYGPFRSAAQAEAVRDAWNQNDRNDPDDRAWVLPVLPASELGVTA